MKLSMILFTIVIFTQILLAQEWKEPALITKGAWIDIRLEHIGESFTTPACEVKILYNINDNTVKIFVLGDLNHYAPKADIKLILIESIKALFSGQRMTQPNITYELVKNNP